MDYEGMLDLVKTRRSIRTFTEDPIADDLIEKIIESARWAPSGANSQPWEFVVIRAQETKDAMAEVVRDMMELGHKAELTRPPELRWPSAARPVTEPAFKKAPVIILVCGDPRVSKSFPLLAYLDRGQSHFISGLASAFLYMTLAASSLGLGCHWVSQVGNGYCSAMVKDLLGIPEDFVIYDMLCLGYPAVEATPRLVREREAMTHREHYEPAKYRSDEQIREYLISLRPRP